MQPMTLGAKYFGWILLGYVFLALQGVARADDQASASTVTDQRVVDDRGNRLDASQPVRRIVSLAPHLTELLYAAGAGPQVVGVVSYSDYPKDALNKAPVGSYNRVDFERVLGLQPDLVVAWYSGNGPAQIERLRQLGLPLYISEPRQFEDIASNIERLARLVHSEQGVQAAKDFLEGYRQLQNEYANRTPVSVFYQIWDRPLMTISGDHLISRVIELCGGVNVFADLPTIAAQVLPESVVARNPQVIVGGGMDGERPEWFKTWEGLPQIEAVRQGHLFAINPDLLQRHTPRILQGARQLCADLDQVRQSAVTGKARP